MEARTHEAVRSAYFFQGRLAASRYQAPHPKLTIALSWLPLGWSSRCTLVGEESRSTLNIEDMLEESVESLEWLIAAAGHLCMACPGQFRGFPEDPGVAFLEIAE